MKDSKSNPQPSLLCIHALAYNWVVTSTITRVDLDPIVPRDGGGLPPDLTLPIKAFASPRAVEVPPQEGLLVEAVLARQSVGHDFRLNSIRFQQGPIHGVSSQVYVIRAFSQLSAEELAERLTQLVKASQAGDRSARQALIQMQCQRLSLPPELQRQLPSARLSGRRPKSWQQLRQSLLQFNPDLPGLDDETDSDPS